MGHRSLDTGGNAGGSVGKLNVQSSEVSLGWGVEGIAGSQQFHMWETWAEVERVGVAPGPQFTGQREAWMVNQPEASSLSKPCF